jgi:hypothetical protein
MLTKERLLKPIVIFPALVFVYFVAFPADLHTLIEPLSAVVTFAGSILILSDAVSPWLYMLLAVAVLSRTVTRVWARRGS